MLVKKVCKQCGKNGYILRLNEKLLCPDCVDLENKEMTADEVVDELVNWYNDKGSLKKLNALHKAHEAKNRRQEKTFILYSAIIKKHEIWNAKAKLIKHLPFT